MADCHPMSPMAMDGGDEESEGEASVHSAISNASDFEDDEQVEYLAMELVNHLPPEMASKLLKNMRTKEKAVQDLVHRNRSLLDSCQRLDEENQTLTDRLRDADATAAEAAASAAANAAAAAAAAPAVPAAPAASVDTSYFQKLERSKEEKILRLQKENATMAGQLGRLSEQLRYFEEALAQARKDMKKLSQQQGARRPEPVAPPPATPSRNDRSSLLDEEEKLYQQLQGTNHDNDVLVHKLQQRQEEQKKKVQATFQAIHQEDCRRIERWGSDVAALLLAIDGLEELTRPGGKERGAAKGKKAAPAPQPLAATAARDAAQAAGERLQDLSAQLLTDFDGLRGQLESAEKLQLCLEQTVRGLHGGAEAAATAIDLDGGMAAVELEAESLRQQVERMALSLEPSAELLVKTEAALHSLVLNAPPGLFGSPAETCLREAREQVSELCSQLGAQDRALRELQAVSVSRVAALQAAHQAHREKLHRKATEELQRAATSFEEPLERMRDGLRQQSEVMVRARGRISSTLEELEALARRGSLAASESAGGATGSGAGAGGGASSSSDAQALHEALLGGLREIRGMGRSLTASLDEGSRALAGRLELVLSALSGEPAAQRPAGQAAGAAPSGGGGGPATSSSATAAAAAEAAKKKKNKKKGRGEAEPRAAEVPAEADGDGEGEERPASSAPGDAAPSTGGAPPKPSAAPRRPVDEDAKIRKEFAALFPGGKDGGSKAVDKGVRIPVLSGPELLHELQSLRTDTEALEARMKERLRARGESQSDKHELHDVLMPEQGEQEDGAAARAAPKARRKKMFV